MNTLFESTPPSAPLAEVLRPTSLHALIGQQHLLAPGKPLHSVFASGKAHSMILWGPPGVGKTTLARLIAGGINSHLITLSAVFAGVKDIREAVAQAQRWLDHDKKATILFIDEIHRFNKAQQDALLPFVESGLITFIGATTENPSFEINQALLSRAHVYVLKALSTSDLLALLQRANEQALPYLAIDKKAADTIVHYADGDARRLLNLLEQIDSAAQTAGNKHIDAHFVTQALGQTGRRFDKQGEYFYDQISALHKSVRGSHPDAALYWLCRMLEGGADPGYLARRIIRMAWEDSGLADPRALQIANEAANSYERLGSPEGELALAQAVIYLATSAKSNAGYLAYQRALAYVKADTSREVPLHLRNAPTNLMKALDYGQGYRYAHDEPHGYAAGARYLPDGMAEPCWYQPVNRGLESKIAEKLAFLKTLDQQATGNSTDHS